ncbi:hypothetical protein IMCC3317_21940 [Kordia antarctica]|uniref:Gliding motility-associated protein GldM N-terminal domain-containing protein n=1 Tax=Kordia antarctica TaxID=1218801 RepID=A0A7L4ZLK1_9FLAO|nr:hypothetical protein [Kordia antarctica]QHI36824.1 hypothetical protein IMCC3317_21940 [Kordia antarctica]
MSKKIVLITVFIVSLMLIGLMMLVADAGNNPTLNDYTTSDQEFRKINLEEMKSDVDSLSEKIKSQQPKAQNAALEKFNIITEDVLAHIKSLQQELFSGELASNDLSEPKVEENNALFFTTNDEHSEKSKLLIAKIDAFENNIRTLKLTFPELNSIKPQVRDEYTNELDWLFYNFKDFPSIASYIKLKKLAEDIKIKRKDIFTAVLNN